MYNEFLTATGQFAAVFSPDECRRIVELPLPAAAASVERRSTTDVHRADSGVDYGVRRTGIRSVPPTPEYLWIFERLAGVAGRANRESWRFQLSGEMSVDVLQYDPDGYFDWHVDIGPGVFATRKLSMVTFLTPPDAYEGGSLRFMDGSAPVRLAQGTTLIFPAYLLHKVEPVTRGTRHTLVSWAHGPSFT